MSSGAIDRDVIGEAVSGNGMVGRDDVIGHGVVPSSTATSDATGGLAVGPDTSRRVNGGSGQGLHVAIIMDGNGRWATTHGKRREWGHRQGAKRVRGIVEAAPDMGISTLTLYAFSADNWKRPQREVSLLMRLFRRYLRSEVADLKRNDVRLKIVGRRDRLDPSLVRLIDETEAELAGGTRLTLRMAIDYSSRDMLLEAVRAAATRPAHGGNAPERTDMSALLGQAMNDAEGSPDVDLLIRTGGEQRLSDFLLWECAYAELFFTPTMWPDFGEGDLRAAVHEYASRERRFGDVAVAV